jgi:hypothetical protein
MHASYYWPTLVDELDRWHDAGHQAQFWLRDDDAHEPTAALDELLHRLRSHGAPCLLAVIPMHAGEPLATGLRDEPLVRIAMHGAWHINHAPAGRKSAETPVERGIEPILAELAAARTRLIAHFGETAGDWYVPPWNRMDKAVAARLPDIGFSAISTFADDLFHRGPALAQVNTHIDLMDWKGGRAGRTGSAVALDITKRLAHAREQGWGPVGILAHHLVHDAVAWSVMDMILNLVSDHPAAVWSAPDDLLDQTAPEGRAA